MEKPKTVNDYIKALPKDVRIKVREIRAIVRKAAPGAEESIKWSMPAMSKGRIIVMYAGFKNHVSLFPTPSGIKAFAKELKGYTITKGTIQFPLDRKLPAGLIKKITAFRTKECAEQNAKWRS
jgi:uncharacterized protein YdhG (YjbR/CyaY superfamily)